LGMGSSVAGLDDLTMLEEKVELVVGRMDELRNRNSQLDNEIHRLREELSSRDDAVEQLRRDLDRAKTERRDIAKEEAIRGKLTTLLGKIEALESVSDE
jgi:chromosome segregation ATPase